MIAENSITRFARMLTIAHHIPGRIRLKLTPEPGVVLQDIVSGVQQFGGRLNKISGVKSVSLNILARSCIVEYDPERISPAAWQDLVMGRDSAAASSLMTSILGSVDAA